MHLFYSFIPIQIVELIENESVKNYYIIYLWSNYGPSEGNIKRILEMFQQVVHQRRKAIVTGFIKNMFN